MIRAAVGGLDGCPALGGADTADPSGVTEAGIRGRLRSWRRPGEDVGGLMQAFSEILLAPPGVEILRVDETPTP
jgi:hypothetical protein